MKNLKNFLPLLLLVNIPIFLICGQTTDSSILIEAEAFTASTGKVLVEADPGLGNVVRAEGAGAWLAFDVQISEVGRYRCEINVACRSVNPGSLWIEDYYDNRDGRTYNITGRIEIPAGLTGGFITLARDGSPLNSGWHRIKLHLDSESVKVDWIRFTLLKRHQFTPKVLKQSTAGHDWKIVWSDEFDGSGVPDTSKWTFDFGNWGWGNNESQYYTTDRTENARQENGNLIIEARKNDLGDHAWTSARLTTRGKVSFVYGKIEFRAKVPLSIGTWAAGWLLGDAYRDELSWPYCGEVDILECIGRQVNPQNGDGVNHTSCHTRAYYFKQGNQISRTIPVPNMTGQFHTYGIVWKPDGISGYMDEQIYFKYDKLNGELEWPFNNPQNIIINLAMGGGMGGNIDSNLTSAKLAVDYIRVYELR
jgi:beta-glucanase (GH16 family)